MRYIFTSESVTEGHPDKIADQVSDAVLDAVMADDPMGRVACETLVTTGICVVAGEITTTTYVDVPKLVRGVIQSIGYTDAAMGFDSKTCAVVNMIQSQSPDIAHGSGYGRGGRSGSDVRICVRRDTGIHAAAHHVGAWAGTPAERIAARGRAALLAAGWEKPGQR